MDSEETLKCIHCGNQTDYYCEDCDQPVCDDCTEPFTLHNQLDGTHCSSCYDESELVYAEKCQKEEAIQEELEKKRKKKNHKAWLRYHTPEQYEKRRLKKIELAKERREAFVKRMQKVGDFMKGVRF